MNDKKKNIIDSEYIAFAYELSKKAAVIFQVTPEEIRSKLKKDAIVKARYAIFYYLIKEIDINYTLKIVGSPFLKDHSAILHAIKIAKRMLSDKPYQDVLFKENYSDFINSLSKDYGFLISSIKNEKKYKNSIMFFIKKQGI